jgi:hypothetical protein
VSKVRDGERLGAGTEHLDEVCNAGGCLPRISMHDPAVRVAHAVRLWAREQLGPSNAHRAGDLLVTFNACSSFRRLAKHDRHGGQDRCASQAITLESVHRATDDLRCSPKPTEGSHDARNLIR